MSTSRPRWFHLPTPRELGWSDYDALESRRLSPEIKGYCWEDWHAYVRELHPVKYFLRETLPEVTDRYFVGPILRPFKMFWHWTRHHCLPKHRYHVVKLSQPDDEYTYGWCDTDHRMLYAMFNLLNEFVEREMPRMWRPSDEDLAKDPGLKDQRKLCNEITEIHDWWNITRKNSKRDIDDMLTAWHKVRFETKDYKLAKRLLTSMTKCENKLERDTDRMISRLMKIRRQLWT